jgi:hypothetical protein
LQPELKGIDFDQSAVVNILSNSKIISKIQADPENQGAMTIYFDFPVGDRQINARDSEKEKNNIKKAAVRQAKRDQK